MTVEQRMIEEYGSVRDALQQCAVLQMNKTMIGKKYGCGRSFIRQLSQKWKVVISENPRERTKKPPQPKKERSKLWAGNTKKKEDDSILGITSCESRKGMTSAIQRGEEYFREVMIAEQVKVFKPEAPTLTP